MEINTQAAVVTGGASGLGAATARALAAAGCKVAILDCNPKEGAALAAEIGGVFCQVDVSKDDQIAAALAAAEAKHGVSRVLVNCAGVTGIGKTINEGFDPLHVETIRRNIEINLYGTLYALARFAARLAHEPPNGDERGVIINTASIAAYEGQTGQIAYAASKGGVLALTLPAARDLAPHAIRVMTIAPGMFRTAMVGMLTEEGKDRLGAQVPFPNRLGNADEFAQLVLSIIANPMLNGEVIRLDGAHRLP